MTNRGWKNQRGSLALEMVGVIPLVLMLTLMVVQFALAAHGKIVAEAAARDAARVAAVDSDLSRAQTAAANAAYGFPTPATTVSKVGDTVQARVVLQVPIIQLPFLKGKTLAVTGNAVMVKE